MSTLGPVTNICIISDKKNCPPQYLLLDRTTDNDDADFWKDSFFTKVKRYLCYTRDDRPSHNQHNQVITDLALIGLKDQVPPGYTAIRDTADSREQALRKHVLCLRYVSRTATASAVVDVALSKDDSYKRAMYTMVGEVNGVNLTFKLAPIALQASRPAPPPPRAAMDNISLSPPPVPAQRTSLQASQQPTYGNVKVQRMSSQSHVHSGIEGVPFKLNERLTKHTPEATEDGLRKVIIKTMAELTESTSYDFSKERSLISNVS